MLLSWAYKYKNISETLFLILWGMYSEVELLDQ
jgi:hypothetical protein